MGTVVVFAAFALPEPTDFSAFGPIDPVPAVVPASDTEVVRVPGGTRITYQSPSGTRVWTVPDPYVATPALIEALKSQNATTAAGQAPARVVTQYRFTPYKATDCPDGRCPLPR